MKVDICEGKKQDLCVIERKRDECKWKKTGCWESKTK